MTVHKLKARYEAGRPSPYHVTPPLSQSADFEIARAYGQLKNWARHLADNSSIVNAVLSSRVSNAIGEGLTYEPQVKDRSGNLITGLNDAIRREHDKWSKSVDTTGEITRQDMECMAWRIWDLEGETFIRRVRRMSDSGLPYLLQQIESDWIPYQLTHTTEEGTIVMGILKDDWGKPIRYYIDPSQQGSLYSITAIRRLDRMQTIDAGDMWHLKRIQRVNQTRGVTLFHDVIFRIADIAEFEQSHRLAARASADQYASINRSPDADPADDDRGYQIGHLQVVDDLAPGESMNFHSPQHPNQNAVDFTREDKRAIAASCDVGFSQIAQVFDASYAAQRLEVVDVYRKTRRDLSKFVSTFARPALYEQPLDAMLLADVLPRTLLSRADPRTLYDVRIDGPRMPVIDPVKDRNAYQMDQEHGWDSRQGIMRRLGRVPSQVDAERDDDEFLNEIPDQST